MNKLLLTIILILLMASVAWGEEIIIDTDAIDREATTGYYDDYIIDLAPPSKLHFESPDGRRAVIDFGGEAVTYSGDLSVDESAKLFFEAFRGLCDNWHETQRAIKVGEGKK